MNQLLDHPPNSDETDFSLIRNDLLFRMQRKTGLIPVNGLGIARRALFWSLLAWLPVAIWSAAAGRLFPLVAGESMLQHFGVNVRCLLAIPLFIAAEAMSHRLTTSLLPYFETSGLVRASDQPRFRSILLDMARLRDALYPWMVMLSLIVAAETVPQSFMDMHELNWAAQAGADAPLGFGGWWYLHVSRTIFMVLLLAWLWRVMLLMILFYRLTKLDLQIVPTHPDGAGGMGFIERFPKAFSPVLFAISAVASAKWAHSVLYHGTDIHSLKVNMLSLAIVLLLIFASPYLVWIGKLSAARKRALLEYGALVGIHGRLVKRRWIDKTPVEDDGILSAPELGPVADTVALFDAVRNMHVFPLGKQALLALAVPIAVPMLGVVALQIPIKEILFALLKAVA